MKPGTKVIIIGYHLDRGKIGEVRKFSPAHHHCIDLIKKGMLTGDCAQGVPANQLQAIKPIPGLECCKVTTLASVNPKSFWRVCKCGYKERIYVRSWAGHGAYTCDCCGRVHPWHSCQGN